MSLAFVSLCTSRPQPSTEHQNEVKAMNCVAKASLITDVALAALLGAGVILALLASNGVHLGPISGIGALGMKSVYALLGGIGFIIAGDILGLIIQTSNYIDSLKEQLETASRTPPPLQSPSGEVESEEAELEKKLKLQEEMQGLQKQMESLKERAAAHQADLAKHDTHELQPRREELQRLNVEISEKTQVLALLTEQIQKKVDDLHKLKQGFLKKEKEFKNQNEQTLILRKEAATLRQERSNLKADIASLKGERSKLSSTLNRLKSRVTALIPNVNNGTSTPLSTTSTPDTLVESASTTTTTTTTQVPSTSSTTQKVDPAKLTPPIETVDPAREKLIKENEQALSKALSFGHQGKNYDMRKLDFSAFKSDIGMYKITQLQKMATRIRQEVLPIEKENDPLKKKNLIDTFLKERCSPMKIRLGKIAKLEVKDVEKPTDIKNLFNYQENTHS